MKKPLKTGKASHRTQADRKCRKERNKSKREKNWRKLRGEFKEDLKGINKFRKLSRKNREALGGRPQDKCHFWSAWIVTVDCCEFIVNCSSAPIVHYTAQGPLSPSWEIFPGSQNPDLYVSVWLCCSRPLTLTSRLIYLRHQQQKRWVRSWGNRKRNFNSLPPAFSLKMFYAVTEVYMWRKTPSRVTVQIIPYHAIWKRRWVSHSEKD